MNFPLQSFMSTSASNPWTYVVFGLIGFAFGFTLEMSGFGNSRKLAAQFYFKDLTVLKVMFTAIVVAMVLLFLTHGLGLLNLNQVWVNPTYLASGIVGGLIMGVGFILGGFCPGTSLVAASTGKVDGMFFLGGGLFGAFLFGESEKYFDKWYNTAGSYGRLTLPEVFHLPSGVVVVLVVLMALLMFWGAEQLEHLFGGRDLGREPKIRLMGAGALLALALWTASLAQPTSEQKWARLAAEKEPLLIERQVQVSPAELFHAIHDQNLKLILLDVRSEAEYNLFHLRGARNVPLHVLNRALPDLLVQAAPNAVYIVMSNEEELATEAWKRLVAEGLPNVYILEGGLNQWLRVFHADGLYMQALSSQPEGDQPAYNFIAALGDRYRAADPNPIEYENLQYTPKIKLQLQRDKSGGGCG